jgi:hypothetical protein
MQSSITVEAHAHSAKLCGITWNACVLLHECECVHAASQPHWSVKPLTEFRTESLFAVKLC